MLRQAWLFIFGTVAGVLLLSLIPEMRFGSLTLRRVDILSDLFRADTVRTAPAASVKDTVKKHTAPPDTLAVVAAPVQSATACPPHEVCIADYSDGSNALASFTHALAQLKATHKGKVRIAWLGDSFVEGDVMLAHLRDTLQHLYGGTGVGLMPLTSPCAKIRPTIKHTYSGWEISTIIDNDKGEHCGLLGAVWHPKANPAIVTYAGADYLPNLTSFPSVRFFYANAQNATLQYSITPPDGKPSATQDLPLAQHQPDLQECTLPTNGVKAVTLKIAGKMDAYGMSMEDANGIYIDNLALRGNPGRFLQRIAPELLAQFDAKLHYDLLVVQYGLNVSDPSTKGFDFYEREMTQTLAHLRKAFPRTPILMIGVTDRSQQRDGVFVPQTNIPTLIAAQKKAAQNAKVAFWDTFAAMGGAGSMTTYVQHGRANTDYTHINFRGGQTVARLLSRALLQTAGGK